jgi:predicted enzyme related to lactoylglutathione lyase
VRDLDRAVALFSVLAGGAPYMHQPYYAGFSIGGHDVGLDPNGHARGLTGPTAYWLVEDLEATVAALVGQGATVAHPISEVGGGRRVALLQDADGNHIGLTHG